MAALDIIREFISLHHKIQNEWNKINYQLNKNWSSESGFRPELFSTPEEDIIYIGLRNSKYNILFKKELYVREDGLDMSLETICVGERYAQNLRNKFDDLLFDEVLARINENKIVTMQRYVTKIARMREKQILSRRGYY